MSLEFRHIASYLIWYCSRLTNEELLHEVILCVGYFTILNPENQVSNWLLKIKSITNYQKPIKLLKVK